MTKKCQGIVSSSQALASVVPVRIFFLFVGPFIGTQFLFLCRLGSPFYQTCPTEVPAYHFFQYYASYLATVAACMPNCRKIVVHVMSTNLFCKETAANRRRNLKDNSSCDMSNLLYDLFLLRLLNVERMQTSAIF